MGALGSVLKTGGRYEGFRAIIGTVGGGKKSTARWSSVIVGGMELEGKVENSLL
jgi:hypothetical protein